MTQISIAPQSNRGGCWVLLGSIGIEVKVEPLNPTYGEGSNKIFKDLRELHRRGWDFKDIEEKDLDEIEKEVKK